VPDAAAERLSATVPVRAVLAGMLYGDPARCPPGAVTFCLHTLRDAARFDATLRAGRAPGPFTGPIDGVPVTIAWGTRNRILPACQARRAVAVLAGARLVWLPGCGHVPMNDAPERIAGLILTCVPQLKPPSSTRICRLTCRNAENSALRVCY
jgi:pimeloyl-ACP methyl ester carboxylesterase